MGKTKKSYFDNWDFDPWHTTFLMDHANSVAQKTIVADGQTEANGASDVGIQPAEQLQTAYHNSLESSHLGHQHLLDTLDSILEQQSIQNMLSNGYLNTESMSQQQSVLGSDFHQPLTNSSSTMSTKKTKSSALKPVTSTLTGQLQASTTLREPVTMSSTSLKNLELREKARKIYPESLWSLIDATYPV